MSLQIINCVPQQAVPEGMHELARIRCGANLGYQPWVLPLETIGEQETEELWCVPGEVRVTPIKISGGVIQQHLSADHSMFWLQLDASQFDSFAIATAYAWQQVLYSLQLQHRHLLKTWHYLPGINLGNGDDERYRQFCLGRAHTLQQAGYSEPLPAATAIGIPDADAPIVIYWLTSNKPGNNIENPRQVSAWEYPRDYGPSSPNFSRATLDAAFGLLLISGTASVVGHATSHPLSTLSQTNEMLNNLDKLLEISYLKHPKLTEQKPMLRVYLRDSSDWPGVQKILLDHDLSTDCLLPLIGHICRQDLMVELDGLLLAN